MVERITTTGLQLELLTFVNFKRLEALLGWNNSLIPASTYYSHNYSRIIGTGLGSGDSRTVFMAQGNVIEVDSTHHRL